MASDSSEPYVIVHRSYDPIQTDMIGELLRENGIAARVLGTRHGAVIGVAQNILQMHIEVPRSQAGQATDFLEAFFDGDGEELLREHAGLSPDSMEDSMDDGTDGDDDDDREDGDHGGRGTVDDELDIPDIAAALASDGELASARANRAGDLTHVRPLFAAGASLLLGFLAGAHLYCRRHVTAGVIVAGHMYAFVTMMAPNETTLSSRWDSFFIGFTMSLTLVALDLVIGQLVVRETRRGVRATIGRQLWAGALMVAVAGGVGSFIGPRVPEPERTPENRAAPDTGIHAPSSYSFE